MARNDRARLKKALRGAGATLFEWRAAGILLGVNGIENALEYVQITASKRKLQQPQQLMLGLEAMVDETQTGEGGLG